MERTKGPFDGSKILSKTEEIKSQKMKNCKSL